MVAKPRTGRSAAQPDALGGVGGPLRRYRGWIAGFTVLATGFTALAAYQMPQRYEAVSRLIVTPTTGVSVPAGAPEAPAASRAALYGEVAVIASDRMLERLAAKMALYKDLEFRSGGLFGPLWPAGGGAARTVDTLRDRVSVRLSDRANIIAIGVETRDPEKSARLANGLAALYVADQLDRRLRVHVQRRQWLAGQIARLGPAQPAPAAKNAAQNTAGDIGQQLRAARKQHSEKRRRLERARGAASTRRSALSIKEVRGSAVVRQLRKREKELLGREVKTGARLGALHPSTIELRADIETLRNRIDDEVDRVVDKLEDDVAATAKQVKALNRQLSKIQKNFAAASRKTTEQTPRADAPVAPNMYAALLKRMGELNQFVTLQIAGAEIMSAARAPLAPSSPRHRMIIGLGFLVSAAAALLFVGVFVRPERGFQTAALVEQHLDTVALASIPRVTGLARQSRLSNLVMGDAKSPYADAIRALRGAVMGRLDARVIAITSTRQGEGKTTLAASLARLCAVSGGRILLIDGDLRKPSIAGEVGCAAECGLIDLFTGRVEHQRIVRRDPGSGLHVLAPKTGTANPPDLFSSREMRSLIETLKESYDAVVIDAPAMIETADAGAIARLADTSILVVESGRTPKREVVAAYRQLIASGVRVAGIVLQKASITDPITLTAPLAYPESPVVFG